MTHPTGDTSNTGTTATTPPQNTSQISDRQAEALLSDAVQATEAGRQATPPATQGTPPSPGDAGAASAGTSAPAPQAGAASTGPAVNEHGFPDNTPWTQMTPEQQVAYWRHQSRRHEDRVRSMGDYDALKAKAAEHDALVEASKTEQERAVDEARRAGRAEAMAKVGDKLVEAALRSAALGRVPEAALETLLENLDRRRFMTGGDEPTVDTDKVRAYIDAVAPAAAPAGDPPAGAPVPPTNGGQPANGQQPPPATRHAPDMGQGRRDATPPSGLEAGRAVARARLGKPDTNQPAQ